MPSSSIHRSELVRTAAIVIALVMGSAAYISKASWIAPERIGDSVISMMALLVAIGCVWVVGAYLIYLVFGSLGKGAFPSSTASLPINMDQYHGWSALMLRTLFLGLGLILLGLGAACLYLLASLTLT